MELYQHEVNVMSHPGQRRQNSISVPQELKLHYSTVLDDAHIVEIRRRESQAELETRLRIQEADAQQQRRKDLILFSVTLTFALLLVTICIAVILLPNSSTTSLSWAREMLTSLTAGVCGYLFGRGNIKK